MRQLVCRLLLALKNRAFVPGYKGCAVLVCPPRIAPRTRILLASCYRDRFQNALPPIPLMPSGGYTVKEKLSPPSWNM